MWSLSSASRARSSPTVPSPKPGPDQRWYPPSGRRTSPAGALPGDVSVRVVSSLLIRNARLVPLHPGETAPDHPVDVAVEDGVVTAVAPGAERPAGAAVVDAGGR